MLSNTKFVQKCIRLYKLLKFKLLLHALFHKTAMRVPFRIFKSICKK